MGPEPRSVRPDEAADLMRLERAANLVALRHVFDPAEHAFPEEPVRQRWERLVGDPDVVVEVVDAADGTGVVALLAHGTSRVLHLAVRPDHWGRGLAGAALGRAEATIRSGGRTPELRCLQANHRARRLYEARGWRATGASRPIEFPPYPLELDYELA